MPFSVSLTLSFCHDARFFRPSIYIPTRTLDFLSPAIFRAGSVLRSVYIDSFYPPVCACVRAHPSPCLCVCVFIAVRLSLSLCLSVSLSLSLSLSLSVCLSVCLSLSLSLSLSFQSLKEVCRSVCRSDGLTVIKELIFKSSGTSLFGNAECADCTQGRIIGLPGLVLF